MGVDGALVEGVELTAVSASPPASRIDAATASSLSSRAPDEMDAGALTGEGPGDGTTDRPAGAVDQPRSCSPAASVIAQATAAGSRLNHSSHIRLLLGGELGSAVAEQVPAGEGVGRCARRSGTPQD